MNLVDQFQMFLTVLAVLMWSASLKGLERGDKVSVLAFTWLSAVAALGVTVTVNSFVN